MRGVEGSLRKKGGIVNLLFSRPVRGRVAFQAMSKEVFGDGNRIVRPGTKNTPSPR